MTESSETTNETSKRDVPMKIAKYGIVVIVLFLFIGLMLPAKVEVERQIVVDQDPDTVFATLNGFSRFNDWSPWAGIDPNTQYTFSGPLMGKGAAMCWQSEHEDVGSGCQTITAVDGHKRIETALDFGAQGTANGYYEVGMAPQGTLVIWGFETDFGWNIVGRYFGLFMDGMIGEQYEKGLQQYKAMVEKIPALDFTVEKMFVTHVEPQQMLYVTGETKTNVSAIGAALGRAFGQVEAFMNRHGLEPSGPPMAIATRWDPQNDVYAFQAGAPFEGPAPQMSNGVQMQMTYEGSVAKAVHTGSYETMMVTYSTLERYIRFLGLQVAGNPWEVYVTDPSQVAPDDLVTEIYFPVTLAEAATTDPAAEGQGMREAAPETTPPEAAADDVSPDTDASPATQDSAEVSAADAAAMPADAN